MVPCSLSNASPIFDTEASLASIHGTIGRMTVTGFASGLLKHHPAASQLPLQPAPLAGCFNCFRGLRRGVIKSLECYSRVGI